MLNAPLLSLSICQGPDSEQHGFAFFLRLWSVSISEQRLEHGRKSEWTEWRQVDDVMHAQVLLKYG